jgi:lysophospholipase L1-like esterase
MNPVPLALVCLTALAAAARAAGPGRITTSGDTLTVEAGVYVTPEGTVTLEKPATLRVAAADVETVTGEAYVLSNDPPDSWFTATHLRACMGPATVLPDVLVPGSVVVRLADGMVMENGKDYRLAERWAGVGRLKDGRIPDGALVLISYRAARRRIDAVAVDGAGKVTLVRGRPERAAPEPPPVGTGMSRLANIYRPYGAKSVEAAQIFRAGAPFAEPDAAEMARRGALVPKTVAKLRNGEPVTIAAWGDSVTVGDDASSADDTYARVFLMSLRARFPKSTITMINAGISASNTDGRLPALQREVLAAHPDLVTIEFVNDMALPDDSVRANWRKALDEIKAAGAEVIVITPHFIWPEGMKKDGPRGGETRSGVEVLKKVAKEKGVALADASLRWAHLDGEGIPYITLLVNGINHPGNRGHAMYARELLTFFPTKGQG